MKHFSTLAAALIFYILFNVLGMLPLHEGTLQILQTALCCLCGILALGGALKKANFNIPALLGGAVLAFFSIAGLFILYHAGTLTAECVKIGGGAWWSAITYGCVALIGLIFANVFAYLLIKCCKEALQLALAALSLALLCFAHIPQEENRQTLKIFSLLCLGLSTSCAINRSRKP